MYQNEIWQIRKFCLLKDCIYSIRIVNIENTIDKGSVVFIFHIFII